MNRKGFILVREDDELIRELLARWLGEAGYALKPSADERPILVIANVSSPAQAQAQALIEELRVYAAPILVLSGRFRRGLAGSTEAARRLGVKKVLPKPFTRRELLSAVKESIEGDA